MTGRWRRVSCRMAGLPAWVPRLFGGSTQTAVLDHIPLAATSGSEGPRLGGRWHVDGRRACGGDFRLHRHAQAGSCSDRPSCGTAARRFLGEVAVAHCVGREQQPRVRGCGMGHPPAERHQKVVANAERGRVDLRAVLVAKPVIEDLPALDGAFGRVVVEADCFAGRDAPARNSGLGHRRLGSLGGVG